MPTNRVELKPEHLTEAKAAAEARTYTSGDPLVFAHVGEKGLQLRVQAGTVSWILKWNGKSVSLGKLSEVGTVKAAVERAQHVRAVMKRGEDPKEYLKSLAVMKDHGRAAADTESRKARADGAWTWRQLADAYCDEKLSKPKITKQGIKPESMRTVEDFRRYTGLPHFEKHLNDKLTRDITRADIEKIRDLARDSNGPNAGRKVVQWISGAMSWGQEHEYTKTGVGDVPWWRLVSPKHVPQARNRYLTLEQIARVLYIAERYRDIPGRKQNKEVNEATLAALWWIVLTAQRTSASMSLLSSRVVDDADAPGWKIAAFPAENMKSKRYHALPLPPRVVLLLERARMGIDRKSDWAFPSLKLRRNKSELVEDLHIHDQTVNRMILRLRGKDPVGKKRKSPDLLEGIPDFSPHDIRKSLTTILRDLKVRGDAASAVLDHSSGTPGEQEFREADITRLAYNKSQRIELKRGAMTTWTEAVFEAVEAEWAKHAPRSVPLSPPLDLATAKKIPFSASAPWYKTMEAAKDRKDRWQEQEAKREAERLAEEREKVVVFRKPMKLGSLTDAPDTEPEFVPEGE
jgi:integrase